MAPKRHSSEGRGVLCGTNFVTQMEPSIVSGGIVSLTKYVP
jgi:hypothetical protein